MSSNQESPGRHQQPSANGRTGLLAPKLELIGEDETMDTYDLYDPYGDDQSERGDMDFLEVELVRSKFIDFKGILYNCFPSYSYKTYSPILCL